MVIGWNELVKFGLRKTAYVIMDEHVRNPIEDQPLTILDETDIGDKAYGSVGSLPRKFLQEAGELFKSSPPWETSFYLEAQEAAAANKVGGFHGYEYLPGPPNIGTGNSAGTLGMQGGLMILMFAVCYMLYMILKKRVCSFSIGWKDTDGVGELELGGPRDA